jgi:hypothetical protein
MNATSFLMKALVAAALLLPHTFGQEAPKKAEVSPLEAVRRLKLRSRDGVAHLYYSACCANQAVKIQASLEDFIAFYKDRLGIGSPVTLAVLDAKDWDGIRLQIASYRLPYGMPNFQVDPSGYVLFVPADDKGVVTQHVLGDRQHWSSPSATYDEAVLHAILQLAHHEAGHTRVYEYGIEPPNLWLNEMLANYFAYAYEKARDPQTAKGAEEFVKTRMPSGVYRTLEDFEAHFSEIQPANYDWYQLQFGVRALEVYNQQGLEFVTRVKDSFPKGAAKMSVADTLSRLEAICPGFETWAKRLTQ